MCNLHDVSWGTKGDNGAAALGGAKKVKGDGGQDMLEVELPATRDDADRLWAASRNALQHKPAEEKERRDAATKQSDRDKNSRTNTVLAWVATNMTMVLVFTSNAFLDFVNTRFKQTSGSVFNPYLSFLFLAL
jgi:chitin synthase